MYIYCITYSKFKQALKTVTIAPGSGVLNEMNKGLIT
jgi:hypothetical protein